MLVKDIPEFKNKDRHVLPHNIINLDQILELEVIGKRELHQRTWYYCKYSYYYVEIMVPAHSMLNAVALVRNDNDFQNIPGHIHIIEGLEF